MSIVLVVVMLVGVILAGVDQVIRLDGQIGTVIDTTLLIARAILAVLYNRVIHSLRNEDPIGTSQPETVQIDEAVTALITETITAAFQDLSQQLDERLTRLESKQADAQSHLRQETATMLAEAASLERDIGELKRTKPVPKAHPSIEIESKALSGPPKWDIDDIIWPLLNSGITVRAIADMALLQYPSSFLLLFQKPEHLYMGNGIHNQANNFRTRLLEKMHTSSFTFY